MGVDNAEHAGVLHGKAGTHQSEGRDLQMELITQSQLKASERPEGAVAAPWFRSMRQ